ncbi:hypothetical protein [Neisseria meningitidis serogroup B]|uniref:Uncharacterized protein n=1 Tax=Neisseria meningitidis serogroup B TaxID=491 RepID=A0A0H5DLY2_NEIMI|nr:hypothetical protein [Neisseria meningitidis serogroup B]
MKWKPGCRLPARPYKSAKLGCVRANSSEAEKIYFRRFL